MEETIVINTDDGELIIQKAQTEGHIIICVLDECIELDRIDVGRLTSALENFKQNGTFSKTTK